MASPKMKDEETAVSPSETRTQTASELRRVPRGGLAQNMYRMVLQQCLLHSLGENSPIPRSREAAHAAALRAVRESYPDFEPMILGG
jgi:hypothetical protein